MKNTIIASLIAALLPTTALAANVIIENEYVKAGVNETTGTFGVSRAFSDLDNVTSISGGISWKF